MSGSTGIANRHLHNRGRNRRSVIARIQSETSFEEVPNVCLTVSYHFDDGFRDLGITYLLDRPLTQISESG